MELPRVLFSPRSKNKKNPPRKKFLIFHEMELSSSNIKKILIFFYICFSRDETLHFPVQAQKIKNKKSPQGNSLYSWKMELSN